MKSKILFFVSSLVFSISALAQVVPGELKCVETPNDGRHFDIHLQPDANQAFHFKRCDPGQSSGLGCLVYLDTVCALQVNDLNGAIQISGNCTWKDFDGKTYEYGFVPAASGSLQHTITLRSNSFPDTKYYGHNYYCRRL